jgi:hypothetical protein
MMRKRFSTLALRTEKQEREDEKLHVVEMLRISAANE